MKIRLRLEVVYIPAATLPLLIGVVLGAPRVSANIQSARESDKASRN
jgi:hypothetical protein